MSKYKLNFKLKQHTPIIHFQHDQKGATLRASELKPKLDRFLIEKFKQENIDYSDWLIPGQEVALDYKVRVVTGEKSSTYLPLPLYQKNEKQNLIKIFLNNAFDEFLMPAPYFANADKIKIIKNRNGTYYIDSQNSKPNEIVYAIQIESEIDVHITSFNNKLRKKIDENIIELFLLNNFGTRQNKGFGSYTVTEINDKKIDNKIVNNLIKSIFLKKSNQQYSVNDVFRFILREYQLLKSGVNNPFGRNPVYKKSELFKYFITKDIRWEKRFIKKKLNSMGVDLIHNHEPIDNNNANNSYYNSYEDQQKNDYKFIRALLGLAENYEYGTINVGRIKVKINSANSGIERFKSPIFYKVIDNVVYLKADETYKDIEGKEFEFKYNGTLGKLTVPTNFNLDDFINKHISKNWTKI